MTPNDQEQYLITTQYEAPRYKYLKSEAPCLGVSGTGRNPRTSTGLSAVSWPDRYCAGERLPYRVHTDIQMRDRMHS